MSETNKALARRLVETYNSRDVDAFEEVFDPRITYQGWEVRSLDELKEKASGFFTAFPDGVLSLDDVVAEDDKLAVRMSFKGTHEGTFEGIPATGRTVETSEVDFFRVRDGRIVEGWQLYDAFGLMQQLGLVSEEPA